MKIPKYVLRMIENGQIRQAPIDEQCKAFDEHIGTYGYMFRIYRRDNYYRDYTFQAEVERLLAWARREYAEAELHKIFWYSDKEHRKPYYKRDYALVTITDPVAYRMEKLIAERRNEK